MPVISREVIFGKLGEVGMRSLQSAFEFARLRRDAYLEPVHWLGQMLRAEGGDLPLLVDRLGLDRALGPENGIEIVVRVGAFRLLGRQVGGDSQTAEARDGEGEQKRRMSHRILLPVADEPDNTSTV